LKNWSRSKPAERAAQMGLWRGPSHPRQGRCCRWPASCTMLAPVVRTRAGSFDFRQLAAQEPAFLLVSFRAIRCQTRPLLWRAVTCQVLLWRSSQSVRHLLVSAVHTWMTVSPVVGRCAAFVGPPALALPATSRHTPCTACNFQAHTLYLPYACVEARAASAHCTAPVVLPCTLSTVMQGQRLGDLTRGGKWRSPGCTLVTACVRWMVV
jgi:hypothetical protein